MKMKKPVRMPLRRVPPRPKAPGAPLRARAAAVEEDYEEEEEEDYEAGEEPNMKFSHALIVVLVLHLVAVGGVFGFNWMKSRQAPEGKAAKNIATAPATTPEDPAEAAKTAAAAPATIAGWTGKTHTVTAGDTLTRIATLYGTTIEAIEKENGITTYSMIRVGQALKIPGSEKATTKKTETAKPSDTANAAAKQAFIATKTESAKPEKAEAAAPIKATVISAVPKTKTTEVTTTKPPTEKTETAKPATEAASGEVYVVAKGDNPYSIAKKLHVSYNELLAVNGIKDATKIQIGQKLKIPKK